MVDNIWCKLCGKSFSHLGSHIWHAHKMTARDYKEEFGLDYKYPLISNEVKLKKQKAYDENREYYLKNLLTAGEKYRFKKGVTNRQRFSEQSLDRAMINLNEIEKNRRGVCPICKMVFGHMKSHLYNKHGLVVAKK